MRHDSFIYMARIAFLLLLSLLAAAPPLLAQTVTTGPDTTVVSGPALTRKQLSAADSAARTERLFGLRVTRPTKAALLAIVPGAGQLYNRRYWKLPLVYGLLGGLGYGLVFQQNLYREYVGASDELTRLLLEGKPATPSVLKENKYNGRFPRASEQRSADNVTRNITPARRYRDQFILYSLAGYGLQILDALVDAHLYDFDVSEDLSLHWEPALLPMPGQAAPAVGFSAALLIKK